MRRYLYECMYEYSPATYSLFDRVVLAKTTTTSHSIPIRLVDAHAFVLGRWRRAQFAYFRTRWNGPVQRQNRGGPERNYTKLRAFRSCFINGVGRNNLRQNNHVECVHFPSDVPATNYMKNVIQSLCSRQIPIITSV